MTNMRKVNRMDELKPCECGCIPRIRTYRTYHNYGFVEKYYVYCDGCHKEVPDFGFLTQSEAIEAWNRRAGERE